MPCFCMKRLPTSHATTPTWEHQAAAKDSKGLRGRFSLCQHTVKSDKLTVVAVSAESVLWSHGLGPPLSSSTHLAAGVGGPFL